MSRENVAIARQAWTAFTEGGVQATLPYYAEECICEDMPELPDGAVYQERRGVLERDRHWRDMWRDMVLTQVEFIDAGEDAVVVVATLRGHGLSTPSAGATSMKRRFVPHGGG